jgi:hypothetical protein
MKLSSYPHLVKEWHPTKNGDLTPNDFTFGSHKKVWWLCPKGHSYDSIIGNRAKKKKPTGCPYCAGQKVSEENNLLALFPEIAKDWHPTKNNELTPKQVTSGGNKKVWWLCPKGHSYESTTSHRTAMKSGCPYCSGHKVSEDNNLLFLFPEIAKEWHPTKNGVLTPKNFTTGVDKIIWWLCPKGHSYESMINNRTQKKYPNGCPYCSGRRVGEDNNLLFLFPEIAKEWHPTKNGKLTPKDFVSGSNKKVWWLCPKGHSHHSVIASRTGKNLTGCPFCSNQSSQPEIRILSELKWFFDEVNSRYKVDGVEIDIFLPNFNIGIEYDGSYWHKDKKDSDLEKNQFLLSKDIHLIRVRQHPLKSLSKNDVIVSNGSLEKKDIDELLKKIYPFVDKTIKEKINTYLVKSSFINEDLFKEFRSYFPSPFPEHSLLKRYPIISSEWDYDKNYPLRPENFSYGSKSKSWWLCPNGHSYKAAIGERTNKNRPTGCPYCSGREASEDNNLLKVFPEIAKEWHPTKNKELTPKDVTSKSDKKVWWLCPKGHSYNAVIKNKTIAKSRCPYCSNKKASETNNLLKVFPEIAKEWHPTENGELTPKDFTYGSNKNAWWLCPKGHSYESRIGHRTRKKPTGCPYCAGQKTLNYDLFN